MKSIRACLHAVAEAYALPVDQIRSKRRARPFAYPRQIVFWLARMEGHSLMKIGWYMSRDHSTVRHGANEAAIRYDKDEEFGDLMQKAYNLLHR